MRYVIAGAGPSGVIAAESLRKRDPQGEITLIGGEDEPPYSRMAIPYFLSGKIGEEGTHLRLDGAHFDHAGIGYLRNTMVKRVDPASKELTLSDGKTLGYGRLLLATGSRPVKPDIPGIDLPGIHACWTLQDARNLLQLSAEGSQVLLIGAGFIGSIVLDAFAARKTKLTVVEALPHMVARMMNRTGGELIKKWCESKGVTVLTSTTVVMLQPGRERKLKVDFDNGQTLEADLVVTATGVTPNMDYVEGSGIATGQGILVNKYMQTNYPDIYAAGDVAQGLDFSLGEYASVHAIQPTAAEHAQVAAANMAGETTPYRGSLNMNVIETLGLTHYTFGRWMGVEGGDHAEALDADNFQYLRLEFDGDVLVGAIQIGPFEHVGVLRGLIQNRIPLGDWKKKVMEKPKRIMEAYLAQTDSGRAPPRLAASQN